MHKSIDFYLSLISPWSFLAHQRLLEIANRHQATIRLYPVDFSTVFAKTGGLPLPKRSDQRKDYRMQELIRWREFLDIPLNLEPAFFPVNDKSASAMVIELRQSKPDEAFGLAGAFLRACWMEDRDISSEDTLLAIAAENQLDGEQLLSNKEQCLETMQLDSAEAVDRGVFGAPSFIFGDQLFWGQDRLDFLDRELGK